MQNKLRTAALVAALLVLAIGTYLAFEKYSRRSHVATMVKDAAKHLDTVLRAQTGEPGKVDLEAHATALEGYASTLSRMNTSSFLPLADAADDYLVAARQIARRSVEMQRSRTALDTSLPALSAHIKGDHGSAAWTGDAVRLKQPVDKDFRDYRMAVEAYRSVLGSLPAAQMKLAPLVEGLTPIDEALVKKADAAALDAYTAAEQNVKQVADLGAYAGGRR